MSRFRTIFPAAQAADRDGARPALPGTPLYDARRRPGRRVDGRPPRRRGAARRRVRRGACSATRTTGPTSFRPAWRRRRDDPGRHRVPAGRRAVRRRLPVGRALRPGGRRPPPAPRFIREVATGAGSPTWACGRRTPRTLLRERRRLDADDLAVCMNITPGVRLAASGSRDAGRGGAVDRGLQPGRRDPGVRRRWPGAEPDRRPRRRGPRGGATPRCPVLLNTGARAETIAEYLAVRRRLHRRQLDLKVDGYTWNPVDPRAGQAVRRRRRAQRLSLAALLLGIDVGSTSTKVVLVDPAAGVVAQAAQPRRRCSSPHPGWARGRPGAMVGERRSLGARACSARPGAAAQRHRRRRDHRHGARGHPGGRRRPPAAPRDPAERRPRHRGDPRAGRRAAGRGLRRAHRLGADPAVGRPDAALAGQSTSRTSGRATAHRARLLRLARAAGSAPRRTWSGTGRWKAACSSSTARCAAATRSARAAGGICADAAAAGRATRARSSARCPPARRPRPGCGPGTPIVGGRRGPRALRLRRRAGEPGDWLVKLGGAGDILVVSGHAARRRAALPRRPPGAGALAAQRLHGDVRQPDPLVPVASAADAPVAELEAEAIAAAPAPAASSACRTSSARSRRCTTPTCAAPSSACTSATPAATCTGRSSRAIAYGFRQHVGDLRRARASRARRRPGSPTAAPKSLVWKQILADVLRRAAGAGARPSRAPPSARRWPPAVGRRAWLGDWADAAPTRPARSRSAAPIEPDPRPRRPVRRGLPIYRDAGRRAAPRLPPSRRRGACRDARRSPSSPEPGRASAAPSRAELAGAGPHRRRHRPRRRAAGAARRRPAFGAERHGARRHRRRAGDGPSPRRSRTGTARLDVWVSNAGISQDAALPRRHAGRPAPHPGRQPGGHLPVRPGRRRGR